MSEWSHAPELDGSYWRLAPGSRVPELCNIYTDSDMRYVQVFGDDWDKPLSDYRQDNLWLFVPLPDLPSA